MTSSLHILLRCDRRQRGDGDRPVKCRRMYIGAPSTDIAGVRQAAAADGWTFTPGKPYPHIGASDYCPEHPKEPR